MVRVKYFLSALIRALRLLQQSDTNATGKRCWCWQHSARRPMFARTCSINIPVNTTMTNYPGSNVSLSVFLT